jgi:NDP-sugar pyrophosphorylase family protein
VRYAVEDEPLGTAGAIRYAAEFLGERFVVCNGDVLTSLDLAAMVEFHDRCGAEVTISLAPVEDPSAFGVVPTAPDGRVIAFVEKPTGRAPSNWINAGTYVVEPRFLDRIPPRLQVSVERETFPRMLEQERGLVYGYQSDDYWLDIGTPEKYLQAHADVLAGRLGRPPAPGAVEHDHGVWVQGSAEVASGADLVAPVLVGQDAHIGTDTSVRASVLGPRAVVQAGARLDGAVLHEGAEVHRGARVEHSVLGRGATVGHDSTVSAGTLVASGAAVAPETRVVNGRVPSATSVPTFGGSR